MIFFTLTLELNETLFLDLAARGFTGRQLPCCSLIGEFIFSLFWLSEIVDDFCSSLNFMRKGGRSFVALLLLFPTNDQATGKNQARRRVVSKHQHGKVRGVFSNFEVAMTDKLHVCFNTKTAN